MSKAKSEKIRRASIKRRRAYKESAGLNFLLGIAFIVGGYYNKGTPGGTLFMYTIGVLMLWCAYCDSKGEPIRKTSAFSEAWFKNTNESRNRAGLEPFKRPENIPEKTYKPEPFPTGTMAIIIILIIAVLIFHQVNVVPNMEANAGQQPKRSERTCSGKF